MRAGASLPGRQGGYILVLLSLLTVGLILGLMQTLSGTRSRAAQDARTMQALQEAKEALIASALTTDSLPGRLPCPEDISRIGLSTEGSAGSCTNADMHIGRLPWRTLTLPQQADGTGEQLWYVLAPNFRQAPINSASVGKLTLNGQGNLAAIIIAPGPPLANQGRPIPTAAAPPLASDYLDGGNADGDLAFFTNPVDGNDRAIGVSVAELTAPVARRVLAEIAGPNVNGQTPGTEPPRYGLRHYYAQTGNFPAQLDPGSLSIDPAASGWINSNGWWSLPVGYARTSNGALLMFGPQTLLVKPCTLQPCP